jgi:hypothetical protein
VSVIVQTRFCECGCGEATPIAKKTSHRAGVVKGQPTRFAGPGHWLRTQEGQARLAPFRWKGEQAGISPLHKWIRKTFTKTGICDLCKRKLGTSGRGKGTEWAFLRHPGPYTRRREDYIELCRRCHVRFDFATGHRKQNRRAA